MISKVGAPTSASRRTAAEQPAARRTPDKRELERGSVRARRAATPSGRRGGQPDGLLTGF